MKLRDPLQRLMQRARGRHSPDPSLDPGPSSPSSPSPTSPRPGAQALLRSLAGRPQPQLAVVMLSDGSVVFVPAGTSARAVLEAYKGLLLSAFPCDALRPDTRLEGGKTYFMEEAPPEAAAADSSAASSQDLHAQRHARHKHRRQQQLLQPSLQQECQCVQEHQYQHKHHRQYSWHPQQHHIRGQEWQQSCQQPQYSHHRPQLLDLPQSQTHQQDGRRMHQQFQISHHQQHQHQHQYIQPQQHYNQQHQQQQQEQQRPWRGSSGTAAAFLQHIASEDGPQQRGWSSMPPTQHRRVASLAHRGFTKASSLPLERANGSSNSAWGPGGPLKGEASWNAAAQPLDRTQSLLPFAPESPGSGTLLSPAPFGWADAGSPLFPESSVGTPGSDWNPTCHAVACHPRPPRRLSLCGPHSLRLDEPWGLVAECPISATSAGSLTRGVVVGPRHVDSFSPLAAQTYSSPQAWKKGGLNARLGSQSFSPLSGSPGKPYRREVEVRVRREGH